jgi:lysozyme
MKRILLALLFAVSPAHAVTVCPGASSQYGIDVSEFQGNINWSSVKAAGKSFAIIRVSDGTGHLDPYFAQNWSGAKSAGLIRGVYQFFEPGEDAVAQANLLLTHMGAFGPGDLPPMIDVEVTGGQSAATINSKIHQWVNTIQSATGVKPLIYTGGWFWNPDVQSGDFTSYPLVDSYYCSNCCPDIASPWTKWAMWQYSSTGSVGGISGNVDLDRFDGTLDDLNALAGGGFDWSASYVSQSWPLASSSLAMTVNQSIAADIVFKNTGTKTWTDKTRLGTTQPRDRASVFAGSDWIGPNRAAGCSAGAAPGANCKFSFTWHAPDKPGDFHEFFSLVDEGVAWFSDPGQGGPADNVVEAWIHVAEADYHASLTTVSYSGTVQLAAGDETMGYVELKNIGTQAWKAGVTKLAPTPRDQASPLAASDWESPTRVSTLAADVAPGATGRFALSLGGGAIGDYHATFSLVEESVTWFADAPKGGGPADDAIQIHVVVGAASASPGPDATSGGGTSGGAGGSSSPGTSTENPGSGSLPRDGQTTTPTPSSAQSGCSYGGAPVGDAWPFIFVLMGMFLRRRD